MESLSLLIQSIIVTVEHEQSFIVVSKISLFFFLCHLTHQISLLVHMQKNKQTEKVLFITHVRMHLFTCIINLISASRPISIFNKQQKKSFSVGGLAHFFVNMLIIFIFISQIKKNINYNFFLTISIFSFTSLISR